MSVSVNFDTETLPLLFGRCASMLSNRSLDRCAICGVGTNWQPTNVELAGGEIYRCEECYGYFLNPPMHVEYDGSSWTEKRFDQWEIDESRGRDFAKRIQLWFESRRRQELRNILEIGCGSAFMGPGFSNLGINYLGLDVDQASLEYAQAKGIEVRKKAAEDITTEFLGNQHFDLILSSNTFEHVQEPTRVFNSLSKLHFGLAVIIVPNPNGLLQRAKASVPVRRLIQRYLSSKREIAYSIDGYWHNIAYSRKTLRYLSKLSGLEVETLKSISINDSTFGFVQPNSSLAYKLATKMMSLIDMDSQLILIVKGNRNHAPE